MIEHEIYMKRCLQLAKNGLGTTYPNPLVGSVIVYNGKIIGEGWHKKAGEPHAEVLAINSVKNKKLLSKSTIYVSLEPCSHFGKTPPCANLIIEHKIPKVVIGCIDSFSEVAGKGVEKLKKTDEVRNKFLNYVMKYEKNPTKFFEDEIENFQYIANKMIKKISKVYGLAKDDEQVSESILNWDLHQQIMEKKYGKRKIETKYKNWNLK